MRGGVGDSELCEGDGVSRNAHFERRVSTERADF